MASQSASAGANLGRWEPIHGDRRPSFSVRAMVARAKIGINGAGRCVGTRSASRHRRFLGIRWRCGRRRRSCSGRPGTPQGKRPAVWARAPTAPLVCATGNAVRQWGHLGVQSWLWPRKCDGAKFHCPGHSRSPGRVPCVGQRAVREFPNRTSAMKPARLISRRQTAATPKRVERTELKRKTAYCAPGRKERGHVKRTTPAEIELAPYFLCKLHPSTTPHCGRPSTLPSILRQILRFTISGTSTERGR